MAAAYREQRGSRTKVQNDDVEEDLTKVEYETSEGVEVIPTFDSIGLREDLLRGIYAYGLFTNISTQSANFSRFTRVEFEFTLFPQRL